MDNQQDAKDFVSILIKLADHCVNQLTVQQYVFTRIEEILGVGADYTDSDNEVFNNKNAKLFFTIDSSKVLDGPFLRALNSPDNYLQRSASIGLASLFGIGDGNISALVAWINSKFSSVSQGVWEMALPTLIVLVRSAPARLVFIASGGIAHVVALLRKIGANGNAQQVYDLTFVLWTLTLSSEIDSRAFLSGGAIATLVDFLAAAPSRKVARVAVAALRNLADTSNDDVLTEMFSSSLDAVLNNISQSALCRQSNDADFDEDVKSLNDVLLKNYRELSTFDRWASEVQSGALRWGVVHTEKFWKENAKHLEAGEFKFLKTLIELINSPDPVSLVFPSLSDRS